MEAFKCIHICSKNMIHEKKRLIGLFRRIRLWILSTVSLNLSYPSHIPQTHFILAPTLMPKNPTSFFTFSFFC
jgi:hypothetical protein